MFLLINCPFFVSELLNGELVSCSLEADHAANRFTKIYSRITIVTVTLFICAPLIIILFHYSKGTFTKDMMKLPLESMYRL